MSTRTEINIVLIDDQPVIRQGIASLIRLNEQCRVMFEAANGEEALKLDYENIDLIITDISMPIMDGVSFIEEIRKRGIIIPILVLTTFNDNDLFVRAIKAGCHGFVLKDIELEKLNHAIELVAKGHYLLEPQTINTRESLASLSTNIESLSQTEKQILRFAAAGFSNKEIAEFIHLAQGTVKNYISKILDKTDSRDRTQAVVKAINSGLI